MTNKKEKHVLTDTQDAAANPADNVWVQANAGTGKTSVLVQRLLRILFRSNDNSGILCLTYTNAAAGEMRTRILKKLREWATASDADLTELLDGVPHNRAVTPDDLTRARDLFFAYIDNPEMLKVKTFHGFCEEILHRFPIEAGISPSWSLVQDSAQQVLMQEAFEQMIKNAGGDARVSDAFSYLLGRISEYNLSHLLADISRQYGTFFGVENLDNFREYFIDTIYKFLRISESESADISGAEIQKLVQMATDDQNSRKEPVDYLTNFIERASQFIDTPMDFEKYKFAYLTQACTPISALCKKAPYLVDEIDRVYKKAQNRINKQIFDDTMAMFDIASGFARTYRQLKATRNVLDFDDMILYTRRLFSTPENMGWVLSQLDLSLDHILLDEAQDTSPAQWDVLRMLAGDFFTEGDTSVGKRSLFVVGDTKQSIYAFQGADPNAFAASRDEIARQIENNMRTLQNIPLAQSFRSVAPVLETVDAFFSDESIAKTFGFQNNTHKCFRAKDKGVVEIYPPYKKADGDTPDDHRRKYLNIIADKIQSLITSGKCEAKDIMVLVRKRDPFAAPLVTELKKRGIDVAGSDRIVLPRFPAIRDLLNLVRFCFDTSDDYSLCCVLKSPMFRLTERDILDLCTANNRIAPDGSFKQNNPDRVTVYQNVKTMRPEIYARLERIIPMAYTDGPYTFFSRVLDDDKLRREMIAALGTQIIDPLEEFMTICLAYERTQPGTLKHFLKYFISGNSEIKRDMDKSTGVRVVTVHGSKGLEAPVIFMIDAASMPRGKKFLKLPPEFAAPNMPTPWLWTPRSVSTERSAIAAAVTNAEIMAEHYRLLYVAMTRAQDQLYIYGEPPQRGKVPNADSWIARLWSVFGTTDKKGKPVYTDTPIRFTNE